MRKTPSYLKGLAETRARLASDIQRYDRLLKEIAASRDLALRQIEGCDLLIKKFDARLDPDRIKPIQAPATGRRGALRDALIQILQESAPTPVSTSALTLEAAVRLKMEFASRRERRQWQSNSVKRQLQLFLKQGLVERIGTLSPTANVEFAYWTWKSHESASLDHLRQRAEAAGASVQQYDDDRE
jgi:hypothetical protein